MSASDNKFEKSDIGAQSAWKGFSAQTLYIASRLITDTCGYQYYPENIEDLLIKNNDDVIEAVQVKNLSYDLTISKLASSETSLSGEGFFNRMCSLHEKFTSFNCVSVVYFSSLGSELSDFSKQKPGTKEKLIKKLINNHGLSKSNAEWLLDSLRFIKVDINELEKTVENQIKSYVPLMPAPELSKSLLIHHIYDLSKSKGFTDLNLWKEKIYKIGNDISAIDGYYKEYGKSLVQLSELVLNKDLTQIENEYAQGISAHPSHIRLDLDFKRDFWMEQIKSALKASGVALVKGVSGQGKSTLCYRYLLDNFLEDFVFCVRTISSTMQAQNLAVALSALAKHCDDIVIYIDVLPGETQWAILLQELQMRGLSIPVIISIRDEDYNMTQISGKAIQYDVIELGLTEEEGKIIYDNFTKFYPHSKHRTFEDAWSCFGGKGPFIEFVYLLTNNQTLTQRLEQQIDYLLQEGIYDSWLDLLTLVCFCGKIGCTLQCSKTKSVLNCDTMQAAIKRLSDEYLIKISDDGQYIEALHPVRANVMFNLMCKKFGDRSSEFVITAVKCVKPENVRYILLEYFTNHSSTNEDIKRISTIESSNWITFGNALNVMLWLDAKRYVEINFEYIRKLIKSRGKGWLCFLPLDLTGISKPNELIAEGMLDLPNMNQTLLNEGIKEVKESLSSLSIDYQCTDLFLQNSVLPSSIPTSDKEKKLFGYSLFWFSKRGIAVNIDFDIVTFSQEICKGDLQSCADAIRGLAEHDNLKQYYLTSENTFIKRLVKELQIINFQKQDEKILCKFIAPIIGKNVAPENTKNINQYWRIKMLDILKQIYPQKEYIDIELLGVDLLSDIGIKPLDYKVCISKDRRHDKWLSEINSWVKTRIDFSLRPSSWEEYVSDIDNLRVAVNSLVVETIKAIDSCYRKGKVSKEQANKIDDGISVFRNHTFAENRLPQSTVDPYCLYTESMDKALEKEIKSNEVGSQILRLMSFDKYNKFRKSLNNTYNSLDNFYNQFTEVLIARIKRQPIDSVKNPKLAMFNLYSAAKSLVIFQDEYQHLFSEYTSLAPEFSSQEKENLLTLVNVWRHVIDNPIRGYSVAIEAKKEYRNGENYFIDTLKEAATNADCNLCIDNDNAYLICEYDFTNDSISTESEYARIIESLREKFKKSNSFNSNRWYVETQTIELSYVPISKGCPLGAGISIPYYKLFDYDISKVADSLFPCELTESVYEFLGIKYCDGLKKWDTVIGSIKSVKMLLQQYTEVLKHLEDDCLDGWLSYKSSLITSIKEAWLEIEKVSSIIDDLKHTAKDEETQSLCDYVKIFIGYFDYAMDCIESLSEPQIIINDADIVVAAMLLLKDLVNNMFQN